MHQYIRQWCDENGVVHELVKHTQAGPVFNDWLWTRCDRIPNIAVTDAPTTCIACIVRAAKAEVTL